jgi:hypothetical protein
MDNKSRQTRKTCYAKVIFHDGNIPGYLRDISKSGCRIDVVQDVDWSPGEKKKISIIPHEEVNIGPISGTLEIKWTKKEGMFRLFGSQIVSVKDKTSKAHYQQLLSYYQKLAKDQ